MSEGKAQARLNVRLPGKLKKMIEAAAVHTGQTVSEFAVSTLVEQAQRVIQQSTVMELSNRDRDVFLKALDDLNAKPNLALRKAAKNYKRLVK